VESPRDIGRNLSSAREHAKGKEKEYEDALKWKEVCEQKVKTAEVACRAAANNLEVTDLEVATLRAEEAQYLQEKQAFEAKVELLKELALRKVETGSSNDPEILEARSRALSLTEKSARGLPALVLLAQKKQSAAKQAFENAERDLLQKQQRAKSAVDKFAQVSRAWTLAQEALEVADQKWAKITVEDILGILAE
jgi:hypothetical protein